MALWQRTETREGDRRAEDSLLGHEALGRAAGARILATRLLFSGQKKRTQFDTLPKPFRFATS
jgi:hypothetical protein